MVTFSYPTKKIVEKYLPKIIGTQNPVSLDPSIKILGKKAEFHTQPGKYGTLPIQVPSITGVDIPILVEGEDTSKGTIVIIAQDPLREKKDNMLIPFAPNFSNPIVGTPFAYHYELNRYPKTEVYRLVINGLLEEGYKVYVTDIWKTWDNSKTFRTGKWGKTNPHKQCLKEELDVIKPTKVLLMGKEAQNKYKSIGYPVKPIKVPHPSTANNVSWKNKGGSNPKNRAGYILGKVK